MCGRYTQTAEFLVLQRRFKLTGDQITVKPRFNIAPTQNALVIVHERENRLKGMRWGLIPSWAKDPAIGNRMINARSETLSEKPSFKRLLIKRRCLVVADGFYEWKKNKDSKQKTPYRFMLKKGDPFGMAGLWDEWTSPKGDVIQSFTIITTTANSLLASFHERMPVILAPEAEALWLDPHNNTPPLLKNLLVPYPAKPMEGVPVSTLVNSPRNDVPNCIVPVSSAPSSLFPEN